MKDRTQKTSVMLLDNYPILLHGLDLVFNDQANLAVSWKGSDSAQAWSAIEKNMPDLLLMDISLRGTDGLDFVKNVHAMWPKLRIFVFSNHEETLYAERTIRAGAKAYLMKDQPLETLLNGVHRVLRGEIFLSARMRDRMVSQALTGRDKAHASPIERLTDRELEVFRLLGKGSGTRRIAEELRLSVKTIETYRAHIMEKLNLKRSTELVLHAFQWVNSETSQARATPTMEVAQP